MKIKQASMNGEPVTTLYIRVPRCLHTRIKALAKSEGISLNAWMMRCIEKHTQAVA